LIDYVTVTLMTFDKQSRP